MDNGSLPASREAATSEASTAVEAIAAALRLHDVSVEDGFDMFDINKDNGVGFGDLIKSIEAMQLDVTKKDWQRLFKSLGLGKNDVIDRLYTALLAGTQQTCILTYLLHTYVCV